MNRAVQSIRVGDPGLSVEMLMLQLDSAGMHNFVVGGLLVAKP